MLEVRCVFSQSKHHGEDKPILSLFVLCVIQISECAVSDIQLHADVSLGRRLPVESCNWPATCQIYIGNVTFRRRICLLNGSETSNEMK